METSKPPFEELLEIARRFPSGSEPGPAEIKAAYERAGYREFAARIESEAPPRPERCERCGGAAGEWAEPGVRVCRCGGRRRRLLSYLDGVDPRCRMTLDRFRDPDESMAACIRRARLIVAGRRSRGMMLMGKCGIGKTHLLVGLGRALLERDRTAGYYNVVGLITRIQDTYSESASETRSGIIESVAANEVVLLDDWGKEHLSPNVEGILYELIETLSVEQRTLIVSTNLPPSRESAGDYRGPVIEERYDEAIRSRLRALCERRPVKGRDRRLEGAEW